jgi:hypothetical protein
MVFLLREPMVQPTLGRTAQGFLFSIPYCPPETKQMRSFPGVVSRTQGIDLLTSLLARSLFGDEVFS